MKPLTTLGLVTLFTFTGCSHDDPAPTSSPKTEVAAAVEGEQYILTDEPDHAMDVIQVRTETTDNDEVVIVGRIGGSGMPWVEGRAAFSIVDRTLEACGDRSDDHCPLPWDYCCELERLPTSKALIKVIDPDGQLVKTDARKLLGLTELQTVIVQGKATRDDADNLTILATGLYLK